MIVGNGDPGSRVPGRRRLLFLGQTLPYPPDSGVAIRTYHVYKILAAHFEVDALFFWRRRSSLDGPSLEERSDRLGRLGTVRTFAIPQEHDRLRLLADHFRSLATGRPYTYYAYDSHEYARAVARAVAAGTYDVVHMDSLDLLRYLELLDPRRVVCTHHNVESALLAQRSARESGVRAGVMRIQAALLRRAETRWSSRVAANIAVSEEDRSRLLAMSPAARCVVIPNGVDTTKFQPSGQTGSGVVYVGGTSWYPNRDALDYFRDQILPLLRERLPDIPVRWVGRATDVEVLESRAAGIEMTGYVPDVRPYLAQAECVVVPLRVGGGTRLKILDAWAMGKAVVSTTTGAAGLAAENGRNIMLADDPRAFAMAIQRIVRDSRLRRALEDAGRRTAVDRYSWDAQEGPLIKLYHDVLRRATGAARGDSGSVRPE